MGVSKYINGLYSESNPQEINGSNATKEVGHVQKGKFVAIFRPLLVELIGTFLFVLLGMMGVCSRSGVLTSAFSFGLPLMILSYGFGHMSGAYFNPSVTLGAVLAGEILPIMAMLYFIMQIMGGIAAGGILKVILRQRAYGLCQGGATLLAKYAPFNNTSGAAGIPHHYPDESVVWWEGLLIEMIVTFVFVTIFIMVAVDLKAKTGLAPLIVGFTFVACMVSSGAFTSDSLNPARSLGPAIFANQWDNHYVFWIGPILGAVLAGAGYRFIWAYKDRRITV